MTPTLPGWSVVDDDGTLTAYRIAPLSEYQRLSGAVTEISARTEAELWVLVDAHQRLSERLAFAESLRPKVRPHPSTRPVRAVERMSG